MNDSVSVCLQPTLQWQCPLLLLQLGSKPLSVSQSHGPQVGDPHQPLGHWWSILHTCTRQAKRDQQPNEWTSRNQRRRSVTPALVCSSKGVCVRVCACGTVPVFAVLSVVVVSTVTDVSMGGAELRVTLSLVFTGVQMASICAAFSIVAWEREETITDCPIRHKDTPLDINIRIYQFTNISFQPIHNLEKSSKSREQA